MTVISELNACQTTVFGEPLLDEVGVTHCWTLFQGSTIINSGVGLNYTFRLPQGSTGCYTLQHCLISPTPEGDEARVCLQEFCIEECSPLCCELTLEYQRWSNGNPTSPIWNYGDGNSGNDPMHTYWDVNTYQVNPINISVGTSTYPVTVSEGIWIGDRVDECADRLIETVENQLNPPQRIFAPNITKDRIISVRGNLRTEGDDGDYTFDRCDFCMHPSSLITNESSGSEFLAFRRSHLFDKPCVDTLDAWFGIVMNGTNPRQIVNRTHIEGAYNGVKTNANTNRLSIKSSRFDRNYVGLYLHRNPIVTFFEDNTFGHPTDTLYWPGHGHDCDPSLIPRSELPEPFAGIYADNNINLGMPASANNNLFSNLANGIYLNGADGDIIRGCRFWDIFDGFYPPLPGQPGNDDGRGIMQWANSTRVLRQRGLGKTGLESFLRCQIGIEIQHSGGTVTQDIQDNNMKNVTFGIESIGGNGFGIIADSSTYANNNILFDPNPAFGFSRGIFLTNVLSNSDLLIENNRVEATGPTGTTCVDIIAAQGVNPYEIRIDNNQGLDGFYNASFGVSVSNSDFVQVSNNTVDGNTAAGIQMSFDAENCLVSCNTATNSGSDDIRGQGDANNIYDGNITDGGVFGLSFSASTGNQTICDNAIGSHNTGLILLGGATLGNQGNTNLSSSNTFTGPYNGNIAADGNAGNIAASRFFVRLADMNENITNPPIGPVGSNAWFEEVSANATDCLSSCGGGAQARAATQRDMDAAQGSYASNSMHDNLLRRSLHQDLLRLPSFANSHPSFAPFKTAFEAVDGGRLGKVRYDLLSAYKLTALQANRKQIAESKLLQANTRIAELDAELQQGAGFSAQIAERTALQSIREDAFRELAAIAAENLDTRKGLKNSLSMQNNAVTGLELYDQNEKQLYDVFMGSAFIGRPVSASQLGRLRTIADQCIWTGGPAVELARAWYASLTGEYVHKGCSPSPNRSDSGFAASPQRTDVAVKVFPNPAINLLRLELDGLPEDSSDIRYGIYNALGALGQEGQYQTGETIDVSTLSAGVYQIQVWVNDNPTASSRFIISQ